MTDPLRTPGAIREREIDARLATAIGMVVVGKTCCVHVEGEWTIHPESDPEGWMCHAEHGPVYVEHCGCDRGPALWKLTDAEAMSDEEIATWREMNADTERQFASDKAQFGHSRSCLGVVPCFTESRDAFQAVLDVIDARGLGREYAMHLSEIVSPEFDFTTPSDYAWKLLRAPLPLCASAALEVLEEK
jgi:hypothetical protein